MLYLVIELIINENIIHGFAILLNIGDTIMSYIPILMSIKQLI